MDIVRDSGRAVVDVPIDGSGIDVASLPERVSGVYATPAHQHPLGITMSATTRLALLARAAEIDATVIEDDYDSEFRYDVAPLPALATLDRDRVVYLGTASKTVAPGLRLGWLVAPAAMVEQITERRSRAHDMAAWPVQRAFLSMLRDGHVDRVIRSARRTYAQRSALVQARLGCFGTVEGRPAGMYVTLQLSPDQSRRAAAAARVAGFDVPLLTEYTRTSDRHGLVLGFGGCTDAQLATVLDRAFPCARPGGVGRRLGGFPDAMASGQGKCGPRSDGRPIRPHTQEFDMTDTKAPVEIDEEKLMSFVFRAIDEVGATLNSALVVMGDQLGYYRAMADHGPLTPAVLAELTSTSEPYAREWLNAQAAGAYVDYDPETKTFSLPPEHAIAMTDETSPAFLPGFFQIAHGTARDAPSILEAARNGDGLGWHQHNTRRPRTGANGSSARDTSPTWSPTGSLRSTASCQGCSPEPRSPMSAAGTAHQRS